MSNVVDEKVVGMQFDNQQFEAGVKTTMSTLDKLKEALKFPNSTDAIDEIQKHITSLNLNSFEKAADAVSSKFSVMGTVIDQTIRNIVTTAENASTSLIKSLTVEPISAGLSEYETQIGAIQTILANTSNYGTTLEDVNGTLNDLNHYADMTIYNFTQMTKNIGTFTAAGVDLQTSASSIKGIANLAAVSGSTAQQASTAMYQLSQAIAAGAVKLQDWNSVVNAGMGGQVFQNALIRTAAVMNGSAKDVDAWRKKNIDNFGSFRDSLTKGAWLTTDVLTETLSEFTGNMTDAELKAKGYTDDQIKSIQEMATTATDAATKVKTLSQLLDTMKEAVQSGWTQSWQYIIGDFEEARSTLTDISNAAQNLITAFSNERNASIAEWVGLGGRDDLLQGLKNLGNGALAIFSAMKVGWQSVFGNGSSSTLKTLSEGFKNLTANLMLNKTGFDALSNISKGFFSVLKLGIDIVKSVYHASEPLLNFAFEIFGAIGDGLSTVAKFISFGITLIDKLGLIKAASTGLKTGLTLLVNTFLTAAVSIGKFVTNSGLLKVAFQGLVFIISAGIKVFNLLKDGLFTVGKYIEYFFGCFSNSNLTHMINFQTIIETVGTKLSEVKDVITTVAGLVIYFVKSGINKLSGANADNVVNNIAKAFDNLNSSVKNGSGKNGFISLFNNMYGMIMSIKGAIASVIGAIGSVFAPLVSWFNGLSNNTKILLVLDASIIIFIVYLTKLVSAFANVVNTGAAFGKYMAGAIKAYKKAADMWAAGELIKSIGLGILELASAIAILATVQKLNPVGLTVATVIVAALIGAMVAFVSFINVVSKNNVEFAKGVISVAAVAGGILALGAAMSLLANIKVNTIKQACIMIGLFLTALVSILIVITTLSSTAKILGKEQRYVQSSAISILACAGAIYIIASAFKTLVGLKLKFQDVVAPILAMVGIAGALSLAFLGLSKLKFSNSLAVIGLVSSLLLINYVLQKLSESKVSVKMIEDNKEVYIAIGAVFVVVAVVGALASKASGSTFAILALIGTLAIIAYEIKDLSTAMEGIDKVALIKAVGSMSVLLVVFGVIGAMLTESSKVSDVKIQLLPLIAIIGSLIVITESLKALSSKKATELIAPVVALILVMAALGTMIVAVQQASIKADKIQVGSLLAIIIAVGVIAASLAVLSFVGQTSLLMSSVAMFGDIVALALAVKAASEISSGVSVAGILAMVAAVVVIGYELSELSALIDTVGIAGIISAGSALAMCIVAIGGSLSLASKTITVANIGAIGIMIVSILAIGSQLQVLATLPISKMLTAAVSLSLVMLALSGALVIANTSTIMGAASLAILSVSLIAIAAALSIVGSLPVQNIIAASVAIGALALVMAGIGAILGIFAPAAVGLLVLSASLVAIGAATVLFGAGAVLFGIGVDEIASAIEKLLKVMVDFGSLNKSFFTNLSNNFINLGKSLGTASYSIGYYVVAGFLKGIAADFAPITSGIMILGSLIIDTFKDVMGIHSPSIVFESLGGFTIDGYMAGLIAGTPALTSLVTSIGGTIVDDAASSTTGMTEVGATNSKNWLSGLSSEAGSFDATNLFNPDGTLDTSALNAAWSQFGTENGNAFSNSLTASVASGIKAALEAIQQSLSDIHGINFDMSGISAYTDLAYNIESDTYKAELKSKLNAEIKRQTQNTLDLNKASNLLTLNTKVATDSEKKLAGANLILNKYESDGIDVLGYSKSAIEDAIKGTDALTEATTKNTAATDSKSGSTSDASDKQEEYNDILKDGADVIGYFGAKYMTHIQAMGDGIDVVKYSKDAVEAFAESIYQSTLTTQEAAEYAEEVSKMATLSGDELEKAQVEHLDKITDAFNNYRESLKNTIESQMDMFTKFDTGSDVSAQTILDNMQSQIDGVASWAAKLTQLGEAGVNEGILEHLKELGPQGYEYVQAFTTMTAEQLQQANSEYANYASVSDAAALEIMASFSTAGSFAGQGLVNGLTEQQENIYNAGVTAGNTANTGLKDTLGIHSPSVVMYNNGMYITQGLTNGIVAGQPMTVLTMMSLGNTLLNTFRTYANRYFSIGLYMDQGMINGINAGRSGVISAAVDVAVSAYEAACAALEIGSPSKKFYELGYYVDAGFANGISENGTQVTDSVTDMANSTYNTMNDAISTITGLLDGSLMVDPVITPTMDLSSLQDSVAEVSSMMDANNEYRLKSLYGADYSTTTSGSSSSDLDGTISNGKTISFVQNNYSPKSLSKLDIYRQTNNQLSKAKQLLAK